MSNRFLLVASFPDSLLAFRGDLIQALLDADKEVHVVVPDLERVPDIVSALEDKGVFFHDIRLSRAGLNPIKDLKFIFDLFLMIRTIRPYFVFCYTIKPVVYGMIAARFAGAKRRFALITGLGYAFTGDGSGKRRLVRRLVQRLYHFSLKGADRVFFQNSDDENLFKELGILPESVPSTVVNGSGVDLKKYPHTPLEAIKPSFLFIGRLIGDKGVRQYAEAARIVKLRCPEAVFRLVGWIDENPDAIKKEELDEWIRSGVIEFMGKLKDVRPLISQCTVYVLPSYREGTPRTVLEAMAMGRSVITTDAPGCRETVLDGDNGFLVPVKDIDALAEAMMKMIDNPRLVAKMGERSRLIAETKYDVHKVNVAMLEGMGIQ